LLIFIAISRNKTRRLALNQRKSAWLNSRVIARGNIVLTTLIPLAPSALLQRGEGLQEVYAIINEHCEKKSPNESRFT
jgi:hypothetical protein